MILTDVAIIGAPSSRGKSYIQMLVKSGIFISKFYILTHAFEKLIEEKNAYSASSEVFENLNPQEPLLYTLETHKISYEVIDSEDINSSLVKEVIASTPEKYLIYSGYPGQLVKAETLRLGKKFIHVHAGALPSYRGSTTAYYSMLKENTISASAIFLSEGIDEGDVIACETHPVPDSDIDIDHIYEPYIRAKVLVAALFYYAENKKFDSIVQQQDNAKTYYVIHPVLKHIAMLRHHR